MFHLTPSQKLLLFWLVLIGGVLLGSRFTLPVVVLGWLAIIWLLVWLSGQEEPVEILAITISGGLLGMLIWQISGGESWLRLAWLDHLSERLLQLRHALVDRIFMALPEPHGSLLTGILLGNRVKLDRELLEDFRLIGLSHIVAASGYNLAILTVNLRSLLKPLLGRQTAILALTIVGLYILITGAPASILRAGVMASGLLIADYLGRPSRSLNLLVLAAGLLVIFEPKIIFDIGFQLSVAATYGLIRLSPLILNLLERSLLPKVIATIISETLGATLMTAPIIIAYFERLSLVSPLTNLLVLPALPLLMGLGLVACLIALLLPAISQSVLLITWPILEWIVEVTRLFANQSFAATDLRLSGWLVIVLLLSIVGAAELLWRKRLQLSNATFA